jgi:polar amino acid transport system substrate-binding protein
MTRAWRAAALTTMTAVLAAGLAACSSSGDGPTDVLNEIRAQEKAQGAVAAPAAAAAAPACTSKVSPEASYPALPSVPATPPGLAGTIKKRGFLMVGVAGDTRLLGSWNRLTDQAPTGFDIEIAKAIGRGIFGDDNHIRFKVITAGQRFPQVNLGYEKGGVDLVVRAVSMTCDRWAATVTDPGKATGSAFSVAYLKSDQRLLVRQDVKNLQDLITQKRKSTKDEKATAKVCAPNASTSLTNIARERDVTPVPVAIHSDCLALWQEGRVDAITGDDVILAGFKAQDPTAEILTSVKALDTTPYGVAIARNHPELVQYVNAVMATPEFKAAWQAAFDRFLRGPLGAAQPFPTPDYSRPVAG